MTPTNYTRNYLESRLLAGGLNSPQAHALSTSRPPSHGRTLNSSKAPGPPNHITTQNHHNHHRTSRASLFHPYPAPAPLHSYSQPKNAVIRRLISHKNIITLLKKDTDASEFNWPTQSTQLIPGTSGMAGIFRIDDKEANRLCSLLEQKRREQVIKNIMKRLGTGLVAAGKAKDQGRSLREPPPSGAKRAAHFSIQLEGHAPYILAALPTGYGIFQTYRGVNNLKGKVYDTYIYGANEVERFDSIREFIPHLYWIAAEKRGPCECVRCNPTAL